MSFYMGGKNDSICPKITGKRAIGQTVNNSGKKILAVGDSITADPKSHAVQLQQLTGIPLERVALINQKTAWMYDQIKTRKLKSEGFTDLVVLGGVNDIQGGKSASDVEENLTLIYQKAKSEGMRVIALTITPFKPYGAWTSAKHDTLMSVNNWIKAGGGGKIDIVVDAYQIIVKPTDAQKVDDTRFGDNPIHFNAAGHAAIAAEEKAKAF